METPILGGFLIVLTLMVTLGMISLHYVTEAKQNLRNIVENNNRKTQLANAMQNTLRERALSMHAMSVLTDPFDKDEEIQRFDNFGADYIRARDDFDRLPINTEEKAVLSRIQYFTREAYPEVLAVVEMVRTGENLSETLDRIRNTAIPKQRAIAEQVEGLLNLQQAQTIAALSNAEKSYTQARNLILLLGIAALLTGLAIAAFVSRRVNRQAAQLETQAMYDSLTGLANRRLLQHRIEQSIAQNQRGDRPFGVALMDLDRFKAVNDTLGHDVGDELLQEVGRRLKTVVRSEDTVARLGGDEFVLVLSDLNHSNTSMVAQKLLATLEKPFRWGNQSIDFAASLGISLYPTHCLDGSSLLRCADVAMYAAKRSGQRYTLYAPEQDQANRDDLSLKSELREAIQTNQLVLHYQPKIDHRTQHIMGLEALVRWTHPQRGMLSPDNFIPLAEEAGLIGPLTHWVLTNALTQVSSLHQRGYLLSMAVNLSALNLHDLHLPAAIGILLAKNDIAAQYLTLEITESAVMANPSTSLKILTSLDHMGIAIAIDDFGTGYSSLAYLKRLPVDELKIDKSFVTDMENNESDAVIVRSTIDLAHNLGLKVTAEGVETENAWNRLTALGCDQSQGYFMGRPMSAQQLEAWLLASAWSRDFAEAGCVTK